MRVFFLTILIATFSLPVFAQHKLAINVENKGLQISDHLAIKGFVVSKDTTVISAVNLEGDLKLDVPVLPGKIFYDLEVILTRNSLAYSYRLSGNYFAGKDTVINISSPFETVLPGHIIIKDGLQLSTHTFVPESYDKKKSFPHILFITWNNDLLQHEKAWWQNILDKNKSEVILSRVNISPGADSFSLRNLSALLADTLSRYIRSSYRVLPGKDNFIVAGEGMGATIALATILDHEQVFGRSGMFLPLFEGLPDDARSIARVHASSANGMFFFYTGSQENESDRKISERIMDELGAGSRSLIYAVEDEPGFKAPGNWKKWFPEFYKWVFSNGLNYIIR